jgi:hypothetical protein
MKRYARSILLMAAGAALLLATAAPALASQSLRPATWRAPSLAALRALRAAASPLDAAPAGAGVITGTVLDYAGRPASPTYVLWLKGDFELSGSAATDAAGSYSISGVPAVEGIGQLWVFSKSDHQTLYFCSGLTFLDPGPSTFDFQPGRLPLTIRRGGPWAGARWASVNLFGGSPTLPILETDQSIRMRSGDSHEGYAYAQPGAYTSAVVTFGWAGWPARRTEKTEIRLEKGAPAVVRAGQTGETNLVALETDAVRAGITRWASAGPGSIVVLKLANVTAGETYRITGEPMNGPIPRRTFTKLTVPTPAPRALFVKLRIPRDIPTGDKYNFEAKRVGTKLNLVASVQVCAFTASRHSIARGQQVRLRGRVQIITDDAKDLDGKTELTLFEHRGVAAQPRTWQARGWTRVGTVSTDFTGWEGRFLCPPQRPARTMSYVIRFPRTDFPSWRGFTSVQTVRVH